MAKRKFNFVITRITKEFYSVELDRPLSEATLRVITKDEEQLSKYLITKKQLEAHIGHITEVPALQRQRKN